MDWGAKKSGFGVERKYQWNEMKFNVKCSAFMVFWDC
jgi:hypothetical protein